MTTAIKQIPKNKKETFKPISVYLPGGETKMPQFFRRLSWPFCRPFAPLRLRKIGWDARLHIANEAQLESQGINREEKKISDNAKNDWINLQNRKEALRSKMDFWKRILGSRHYRLHTCQVEGRVIYMATKPREEWHKAPPHPVLELPRPLVSETDTLYAQINSAEILSPEITKTLRELGFEEPGVLWASFRGNRNKTLMQDLLWFVLARAIANREKKKAKPMFKPALCELALAELDNSISLWRRLLLNMLKGQEDNSRYRNLEENRYFQ